MLHYFIVLLLAATCSAQYLSIRYFTTPTCDSDSFGRLEVHSTECRPHNTNTTTDVLYYASYTCDSVNAYRLLCRFVCVFESGNIALVKYFFIYYTEILLAWVHASLELGL